MKKLITKFAKWWLRKTYPSIDLNTRIEYMGREFEIQRIDVSLMNGSAELTITAQRRSE